MSTCLHITFSMDIPKNYLQNAIQKKARMLGLEGTAQVSELAKVLIVACGGSDAMQSFVDHLHKEAAQKSIEDMQIEPMIKEKDFRGVFRVIE